LYAMDTGGPCQDMASHKNEMVFDWKACGKVKFVLIMT
jgi:hypothetical protein